MIYLLPNSAPTGSTVTVEGGTDPLAEVNLGQPCPKRSSSLPSSAGAELALHCLRLEDATSSCGREPCHLLSRWLVRLGDHQYHSSEGCPHRHCDLLGLSAPGSLSSPGSTLSWGSQRGAQNLSVVEGTLAQARDLGLHPGSASDVHLMPLGLSVLICAMGRVVPNLQPRRTLGDKGRRAPEFTSSLLWPPPPRQGRRIMEEADWTRAGTPIDMDL